MRSKKLGKNGTAKVWALYIHLVLTNSQRSYYTHFVFHKLDFKRKLESWTASQGKGEMEIKLRSTSIAKPMLSALCQAHSLPSEKHLLNVYEVMA